MVPSACLRMNARDLSGGGQLLHASPDLRTADQPGKPAAGELELALVQQLEPGRYVDVVVGNVELPRPGAALRSDVGEHGGADDAGRVLGDFALPALGRPHDLSA